MKLLTALTLCACAGPLSAASLHLETFTSDTSGWFHISNGTADSLSHDSVGENIQTTATDFTSLYVIADATSSGGAFVGDFVAAGVSGFLFDLNIAAGSAVTNLFFELSSLTGGETWIYNLTLPAFDTTTQIYVPLDGVSWTQNAGSQPFSSILGNTEEIAIVFGSAGTGSLSAFIDNVETVPEPASLTLLGFAALLFAGRRHRAA